MLKLKKNDSETKERIETIIRHTARPCWLIGMTTKDEEMMRERMARKRPTLKKYYEMEQNKNRS